MAGNGNVKCTFLVTFADPRYDEGNGDGLDGLEEPGEEVANQSRPTKCCHIY